MGLPRFYVPDFDGGEKYTLQGPEAHHGVQVLRLQVGGRVTLFNGRGTQWEAEVLQAKKSEILFGILSRLDSAASSGSIELAVALPKGDRQKFLVEKLVELGVSVLYPLETERGVAQPTENALERLRRSVVEASKQCGRNDLMMIAEPVSIVSFVSEKINSGGDEFLLNPIRLIAHPYPSPEENVEAHFHPIHGGRFLDQVSAPKTPASDRSSAKRMEQWIVAVGPEGGFTDREVEQATQTGWLRWQLSHQILRIETAAMVAATLLVDHVRFGPESSLR